MDYEEIKLLREKLRQFEFDLSWRLKEETVSCGISASQCQALVEIGKRIEISIVELSSVLGLDSSSLSRTINGMVSIGLVNRIQNEADRRYVRLTLTETGKDLFEKIEERYNSYYAKVFSFVPPEKQKQVIEGINTFADALKTCKSSSGCCNNTNNCSGG